MIWYNVCSVFTAFFAIAPCGLGCLHTALLLLFFLHGPCRKSFVQPVLINTVAGCSLFCLGFLFIMAGFSFTNAGPPTGNSIIASSDCLDQSSPSHSTPAFASPILFHLELFKRKPDALHACIFTKRTLFNFLPLRFCMLSPFLNSLQRGIPFSHFQILVCTYACTLKCSHVYGGGGKHNWTCSHSV